MSAFRYNVQLRSIVILTVSMEIVIEKREALTIFSKLIERGLGKMSQDRKLPRAVIANVKRESITLGISVG